MSIPTAHRTLTTSQPTCDIRLDTQAPAATGSLSVRALGELDAAAVPRLKQLLEEAVQRCTTGRVFVDLSDVTFMDSSGLGALIYGRNQARACSRDLVLVDPSPAVRDVLHLTGLSTWFPTLDA